MLTACWSVKGGVGTTVVTAALGLLLAQKGPTLIADLTGDVPATLGLAVGTPTVAAGPGLAGWTVAAPEVLPDALSRLEVSVAPDLALLPRGGGPCRAAGGVLLAAVLTNHERATVADCGRLDVGGPDADVSAALVDAADRSLLVLRPCYVAVQRAQAAPWPASGVVLVVDDGRALTAADVQTALDLPVLTTVRVTAAVARAVDSGSLATGVPRTLARDLRRAC